MRGGPLPRGPLLPAGGDPHQASRRCASAPRTSSRWRAALLARTAAALGRRDPGIADGALARSALALAGERARARQRARARARAARAGGAGPIAGDEVAASLDEAPARAPSPPAAHAGQQGGRARAAPRSRPRCAGARREGARRAGARPRHARRSTRRWPTSTSTSGAAREKINRERSRPEVIPRPRPPAVPRNGWLRGARAARVLRRPGVPLASHSERTNCTMLCWLAGLSALNALRAAAACRRAPGPRRRCRRSGRRAAGGCGSGCPTAARSASASRVTADGVARVADHDRPATPCRGPRSRRTG